MKNEMIFRTDLLEDIEKNVEVSGEDAAAE